MTPATYLFEGERLTVAEIHQRVPAISDTTIRRHLSEVRCTKQAMLNFDVRARCRAGGKTAARMRGWQA